MENNNEYFASINEVSKRLAVPAHTLRYWEKQFPVAIRPTTGAGGRRYYRTETVQKLIQIKDLLYTHGMTIAGVKKLLRDGNLPANLSDANTSQSATITQTVTTSYSADEIDTAITLLENAKNILQ
ncbi:MAG: MerR family transcriptional regulator [Alphaproteobacteria bacterium]|nr:MerR family transcriptional regulator [Alphaproteobacteria bacterium]